MFNNLIYKKYIKKQSVFVIAISMIVSGLIIIAFV
jgi:hypothetical protein